MRRDAEIYTTNKGYEEWTEAMKNETLKKFLKSNHRYPHLLKVYGPPDVVVNAKEEMKKKEYVVLILQTSEGRHVKEVKKKIPASTSICNLKVMAKRFLGIDSTQDVVLIWASKQLAGFECELDEDLSINSYSIENEDIIIVQ
jgi:hypothetical protein